MNLKSLHWFIPSVTSGLMQMFWYPNTNNYKDSQGWRHLSALYSLIVSDEGPACCPSGTAVLMLRDGYLVSIKEFAWGLMAIVSMIARPQREQLFWSQPAQRGHICGVFVFPTGVWGCTKDTPKNPHWLSVLVTVLSWTLRSDMLTEACKVQDTASGV